ncbi:PREDICTED: uncharacterized protein LOC108573160 [Habropoda laboriosa]|uniref:uncharacterized protein LOC108573160 n=1 Tax=Habropoda laboriosa TaxID=597456 RepID=UPI00083D07B4|nr:PREDICTED: uncharacterized protein LOC108573160 [Habropoda laboriosa]
MKCTKKDAGVELLQYISKITSQKQNINDKHILPHVQSLKKQSEQRITTIVSNISKIKGKNWLKILHQTLLDNGIIINGSNNFSCTSCKRDIISLHDILTHIKGKSHKNMLKNHSEKLCISDSTNINQKYSLDTKTCTTENNKIVDEIFCSTALNADHNLIYHCQARMFLWKIKELLGLTEMQNEQSSTNNIAIITEHISKVSINDKRINISNKPDNDFIITSDIDAEIKNCLNISPLKSKAKNNINAHINNSIHKERKKMYDEFKDSYFNCIVENLNTLWYSIQRYSCVLCKINFKYKMEFIEHIMAKHNELLRDHVFDFCIPCTTLWLDTKDSYTDHCNDLLHKYLIKSEDFMIENLPGCMHKILTQVDEISDILFKESQFLLNDSMQQEVEQLLENSFKSHFPSVKAYSFGSRVTGLAFRDSDIDIYLDCDAACYQDESEHLENNYITIITQVLQQHTKEWDVRKIIKNARIPVIKLIYKRKNIYCDISITNSLSVENSKLIRSYNDAYLPCRKLILFIKKWYALTWFVIFYLQFESHLESVAALIKKQNKSKVIWGWETGVAQPERNNKSVQQQSISTLLIGFFKFYATFDYQHYIICPLMGQPVARRAFAKLHMLPEEMMPYIKHVAISKNPEYFRIDSPLCVQDPFDLSHNLTKAVSSITLKCFKQYCQDSTSILLSLTK